MADVRERLERRNEGRLAEKERRRAEKDSQVQPSESKDFFLSNFSKEEQEIEEMLRKCSSVGADKLKMIEHFDEMSGKCLRLQKLLTDSTMFLPSYDVKRKQETISSLQQTISERRDACIPKKKFAFRARKKQREHVEANDQQPRKEVTRSATSNTDKILESVCGFRDLEGQTVKLLASEVASKDVTLESLQHCNVRIYGPPSAVHMNKLKDCKIFCGPVSGAVFVDDCQNCTFVLPCHQLRVHSTEDSHFYLHVTSRAIVEDCIRVGFAPFNWSYKDLEQHFRDAGLDPLQNNWSLVNDFNWLRTDEQSPNWSIIDKDIRISTWDI